VSKCGDVNQSFEDRRLIEYFDQQEVGNSIEREFGENQTEGKFSRFLGYLQKNSQGNKSFTEKQINTALKKYVKPSKREQIRLVSEIITKMAANPLIQPMMNYVIVKETSKFDQDSPVYDRIEWTYNQKKERVPIIETIPLPSLRLISFYLNGAISGGKMYTEDRGIWGNIQYEWGSPRQVMLKDPSGLHFAVNKVTEIYTQNAQSWANRFLEAPTESRAKKIRDYGFNDIVSEIINLERVSDFPDGEEIAWRVFSEVMSGRTLIYENGVIMRHKHEIKMPNGIWEWRELEPFTYMKDGKEHTLNKLSSKPNLTGGYSQLETMVESVKKARSLFKLIGREIVHEIDYSSTEETALKERAKKLGLETWLEEKIGHMIDNDLEIAGLNAAQMVSGKYYPRSYYRAIIPTALENARDYQEMQISRKTKALRNPAGVDAETKNRLLREITKNEAFVIIIDEKLDYISNPDMAVDPNTGKPVNTRVWYKNFKNLTRIMNPDMMRYDEEVMTDYVNEMSRAVIRNAAVINVGNALLDAKSGGASDNTINASMDIFNTTFYSPQAGSQFMGVDMKTETVSRHLAAVGINRSGPQLTKDFNRLSAWTTINTLYGAFQGLVNYSAWLLKADRVGIEMTLDATHQMTNPKTQKYWRGLISKSGINTFSDFVDTYFNKALRPAEIKASRLAIENLKKKIAESEKTGNVTALVRFKKQLKMHRGQVGYKYNPLTEAKLQRLAQWVITRNQYYKKNASAFGEALGVAGSFLKLIPSIDKTEQMLRSTSFIIGAMQAVKSGRASSYDSKEAIEAGIAFTFATDFGLSHQHVGAALRGPIAGSTINKMKIWHNQKAGFDYRQFRDALISQTPNLVDSKGRMDKKAINGFKLGLSGARLLSNLLILENPVVRAAGALLGSKRSRVQRMANPYVASVNSNAVRQVMVAVLMDLVIYAPGTSLVIGSILRSSFFSNPLWKGIGGMGSSIVSLGILSGSMAKSLLTGDDEDEWKKHIPSFVRYSPVGIGANSFISLLMWGHKKAFNPNEANKRNKNFNEDHLSRAVSPYFPGGRSVEKFGKKNIVKPVEKYLSQPKI